MFDRINLKPVDKPAKMASYWHKEWRVIIIVAVSGILFNGSMSLIPTLQGKLLDTVIYRAGLNEMLKQAAIFLAVVLAIQLLRTIKRYSVRVFANRTSAVMRRIVYNAILHRKFDELMLENTGDLMNKAVNDVDLCVEGMRKATTEVFDTGVLMAGYLITMLFYDWQITLLAVIFIPIAMYLAERLKVVIVKYNRAAREQSSVVAQLTYSNVEHVMVYRVNGVMPLKQLEYQEEIEDLEAKAKRANVLENSMQPIYKAIAMLGIAAVLYLGGKKVIDGAWTVGAFTAYVTIFSSLALKASRAARLFNSYQKSLVSWRRLKPYCAGYQETEPQDPPPSGTGEIICRNLELSYPNSNRVILKNISFEASRGDFIGVTGPVASGKSTLGLALTGVYPYKGKIQLNQRELNSLTEFQRSCLISYQGHKPYLLSDTIYHNITLGEDGDIESVLADVCFAEDIATMPQGVNTLVGNNGVRLSGGQQARISLARALWHKAPFVILDDPFAAVDSATEAQIMKNLRAKYSDRTFIIISHRLSSFPELTKVLYLDRGTAIIGTHRELLATCNNYRELYDLQKESDQ